MGNGPATAPAVPAAAMLRGGVTARAVLLARNREGFAEVCRIVTSRMLDEDFSLRAALEGASENIYIISGDHRVIEALHRRREPSRRPADRRGERTRQGTLAAS